MTALLPDIACQSTHLPVPLDWVGMQGIAVPLLIASERVAAFADAGVSLDDAEVRGIHMSRLYLALEALAETELSPVLLRDTLGQFLESHALLSRQASLTLRFELMLRRPALVSPLRGWKRYACEIHARREGDELTLDLHLALPYSSTCPCSAALARQLVQERFDLDFAGRALRAGEVRAWLGSPQGMVATPHSQRSEAQLRLRLDPAATEFPFNALIDHTEAALGTAVQTAVKRADEQAFALANGQNLMFCEDAARRLHRALMAREEVTGFEVRVVHAESLHAHDAVAVSRWRRA
ncbi:GTP cyclohydrolase FolE2 [Pseudomonas sp. NY15181]|uniref:GTP cyclohydrolase FolE2 n=1 Tax=Pseudomonas sp. NY15181 TaxID=3400349 RepID=UPI003A8AA4A3